MADVLLTVGVDSKQALAGVKELARQGLVALSVFDKSAIINVDVSRALSGLQKLQSEASGIQNSLTGNSVVRVDTSAAESGLRKLTDEQNKLASNGAKGTKVSIDTTEATTKLGALSDKLVNGFKNAGNVLKNLTLGPFLTEITSLFGDAVNEGKNFQDGVADLGAITGFSGKNLEKLGKGARAVALEMGGSATDNLKIYDQILSKLGPQIANDDKALADMVRRVNLLSKATGDTAPKSADALITSILQMGVDTNNTSEVLAKMTDNMNILAAGAQESAVKVPQVADALKKSGAEVKNAGISFQEGTAIIQAMGRRGLEGAEAGNKFRNVISALGRGRFIPKNTLAEMELAGVNIAALTDKSKSFTDRMRELSPIMNDSALKVKFFGKENAAAAESVLTQLDYIDELKGKISGTNTAQTQANAKAQTWTSAMKKLQAVFAEVAITIFNVLEPVLQSFTVLLKVLFSAITPIIDGLKGPFEELTNTITALLEPIFATLPKLAGPLIKIAGTVIGVFSKIVGAIAPVLTTLIEAISGPVVEALDQFANAFAEILPQLIPAITPLIKVIVQIVQAIAPLISALVSSDLLFSAILPLIQALAPALIQILGSVAELAGNLLSLLVPILQLVVPIIADIVKLLANGLREAILVIVPIIANLLALVIKLITDGLNILISAIRTAIEWVIDLGKQIGEFLAPIFEALWDVIKIVADFLVDVVVSAFDSVVSAGKKLWEHISNFLLPIWNSLKKGVDAVVDAFVSAYNYVRDFLIKAFTTLSNAVQSVWNWIKKTGESLLQSFGIWNKAKAVYAAARGAVSAIGDAFGNLKATVAGIGAIFSFAADTLKSFFDAVTSLDVDAAVNAFDGFFEKAGKAFLDARNETLAQQAGEAIRDKLAAQRAAQTLVPDGTGEEVAQNLEDAADEGRDTAKPKIEKKAKDNPIKIANYDSSADEETILKQQEEILASIEDEITRIRTKARFDRENLERAYIRKIAELDKKAEEDRKNKVQGVEAALTKAKESEQKLREEKDKEINRKEIESLEKAGKDRVAKLLELSRQEIEQGIEQAKAEQDLIAGATVEAIRARTEKALEILASEQEKQARALIEKLADFKTEAAKIATQLGQGVITEEEANAALENLFTRFKSANAQLVALSEKGAKDRAAILKKGGLEEREAEIKAIEDANERERQSRLLKVEQTLQDELELAQGNEALITEAKRKAAIERSKIDEGYFQKSSILYRANLAFVDAINELITNSGKDKNQTELRDTRNKLLAEERDLRLSRNRGLITEDAFREKLAEITKQRVEINKKATQIEGGFWKVAANVAANTFARIGEGFNTSLKENLAQGAVAFEDLGKLGTDILGVVGSQILQMAVTAKASLREIAGAVAATMINIAQNVIAANIVTIYSTAIGLLGPIAGPIAATGAIILVESLLAIAQAKLAENKPKFHTGHRAKKGNASEYPAIFREDEFTIPPKGSAVNWDLLSWILDNNGKDAREHIETAYQKRLDKAPVSPIVMVMQTSEKITARNPVAEKHLATIAEQIEDLYNLARVDSFTLSRIKDNTAKGKPDLFTNFKAWQ